MKPFFSRLAALLFACSLIAPVSAREPAAPKYRFNLPPSAELQYAIKSQQKGLSITGDAVMRWQTKNNTFTATNEVRAMLLGKILEAKTEGSIDGYGLAPASFTEKRMRKDPATVTFDRKARTIRFTESKQTYPIKGGEQDRNSVIWQLISVARGARGTLKPGGELSFAVAGQRDVELWTFKIGKLQKIRTSQGELNTVQITRTPPSGSKDDRLDIWLAPQQEWYPVRVRFTESNGDFIEQTLQNVVRKTP